MRCLRNISHWAINVSRVSNKTSILTGFISKIWRYLTLWFQGLNQTLWQLTWCFSIKSSHSRHKRFTTIYQNGQFFYIKVTQNFILHQSHMFVSPFYNIGGKQPHWNRLSTSEEICIICQARRRKFTWSHVRWSQRCKQSAHGFGVVLRQFS